MKDLTPTASDPHSLQEITIEVHIILL